MDAREGGCGGTFPAAAVPVLLEALELDALDSASQASDAAELEAVEVEGALLAPRMLLRRRAVRSNTEVT